MMFWYGSHWAFWQAGVMWTGMIAFWGLLSWVTYVMIRSANRRPGSNKHAGEARRILDERLARGQIDAEEYRRFRDMISSDSPGANVSSGRAL